MARILATAVLGAVLVTLLAFAVMERGRAGSLPERWTTFAHALASEPASPEDLRAPLQVAAARLPTTLALAGGAWGLALVCALPIGIWAGLRRDGMLRGSV